MFNMESGEKQHGNLLKLNPYIPSILCGNIPGSDSSIEFPLNSANVEDNSLFAVNSSISFSSQKQSNVRKVRSLGLYSLTILSRWLF